jgi:hypothetical protein
MSCRNVFILLAAVVSACTGGGGGGGPSIDNSVGAVCASISGGSSRLTSSCNGCAFSDTSAAADGDLFTAASVTVSAVSTAVTATIRATAQNGIVYPAGNQAGIFFTDNSDVCGNCGVTINTYLGGQLQESDTGLSNSNVNGQGSRAEYFTSVNTTKPFDAVEVVYSGATTPGNSGTFLEVFEICSNGDVP